MKTNTGKSMLIMRIGLAFLATVAIATFVAIQVSQTHAAGPVQHHASPRANLKNLRPLHGPTVYNPLLNTTADQGDITEPTGATVPPALCATYTTNPYANPAPNVDQINGDTTITVGTQTGCKAAQNETTIATNLWDPRNIVAGANDYRVFNTREGRNDSAGYAYVSKDSGHTWTDVQLPHLTYQTGATGLLNIMDSAGDPAISFGPNNTVYYANLVFSRLSKASGIVMSISHNGGTTWSEPSIVHTDGVDSTGAAAPTNYFNDKEWVAVDPYNSRTAYVSWTHFTYADATQAVETESPILVSATHDGGATWSAPTAVNPSSGFKTGGITAFSSGSIPQVGRDDSIYIAYESAVCQTLACDQATDHDATIMAKSTDGGKTFINTAIDTNYDFPTNLHVGRGTLTGENFRINSFPQFTIDRVTGRLYVTWADDRNGLYDAKGNSIKTNGDVFVAMSHDGTTWKHQTQLGTSADEVFPAVAAFAGHVMVSFYTRAYDPTGINLDYAYSTLVHNDKDDFTGKKVFRITTQSENPQVQFVTGDLLAPGQYLQGAFIGDYTAISVGWNGVFYPCWTDFRGNPGVTLPNQDAYTQPIVFR